MGEASRAAVAAVGLALGQLWAGGATARAQETPPGADPVPVVALVAGGPRVEATLLVGPGGQIYGPTPSPDGSAATWRRLGAGGVASDVAGAAPGPAAGAVFAVGAGTPVYRFSDGTWFAIRLGSRGSALLAAGGPRPALAIGRRVFVAAGRSFQPAGALEERPTALWAAAPQRVIAATARGLWRGDGLSWRPLRVPAAAGGPVVALAGGSSGAVVALTTGRALLVIDGPRTAPVKIPAALAGLQVEAIAAGRGIFAIGALPDGRALLCAIERGSLRQVAELPAAPPGDPWRLLAADPAGGILAATHGGQLWLRGPASDGRAGSIVAEPPAEPTPEVRARRLPARSR